MKKRLLSLVLGLVIGLSSINSVYAQEKINVQELKSGSPYVQNINPEESRYFMVQPRGSVISTGVLQISNRGNGNIGVYMQTTSHVEIDETTFGVYLDRWIESEQRWANITGYTFTYTKDEYPEDDLTVKSISFDIVGQPSDCYYRLRGLHLVIANDTREMLSSQTDGILITNK